jgi:hypothetical protein
MRKIKFDKFNPKILIGYTFLGRIESSIIIDIDEVEPNNYKVKRKYFSGNLEKTTSFTKQELYDLYLGKKVDGDEIFATKMAKGGGVGEFKNDGHGNYTNDEGYSLIDQFDGTYEVLDPNGMDIAGEYLSLEDGTETIKEYMEQNKKLVKGGAMSKKGYVVTLEATPNMDFETGKESIIRIPKKEVSVKSIEEAKNVVKKFINDNDLGGGNFKSANIFKDGKKIGYISYNNRVWSIDGNEMKYENGGEVRSWTYSIGGL